MKVKIFSSRQYEENHLIAANNNKYQIDFEAAPLSIQIVDATKGYTGISAFTNDDLSNPILDKLQGNGVKFIALRSSGYDHIDINYATSIGLKVANVPEYSPYAVAEHAIALMLALNRKIIQTDKQLKLYDFTLNNLIGFDMHSKTVGIIGTGKIGQIVAKILHGFGCKILAHDINPTPTLIEKYNVHYCSKEELMANADIITMHCPLNKLTLYTIDKSTISKMRPGVMIINCGRGGLLNTKDAIEGLKSGQIGYLGMDVYEKEKGVFFFNHSNTILKDDDLLELMSFKNVLITPHQAFLTKTALKDIAETTLYNIDCWANNKVCKNELT